MKTLCLLLLCVIPCITLSQLTRDKGKLSPSLFTAAKKPHAHLQLMIAVKDAASFKSTFTRHMQVVRQYNNNILVIQLTHNSALDSLMASDQLVFADLANRRPKEELLVSGFDLGANRVNMVHHYFPALTGEGLIVSVKENRFDTADIDLKGRVINSNIASLVTSGHATIMATMIAGAGNSFYEGKGAAWRSGLQSATFENLLPEPDAFYRAQGISVQNHSYGTAIENYYGADAAAYDASVISNPVLLHVFSSGNSGTAAGTGPYAGIAGYANLTGSFKMAKNVLVVGAIDSTVNIELPSSRGPAYDGRIKPEVVAFGQDGSSGAAAIVSGISLLMQQAYKQLHNDSLPAASLVKALLINTAEDAGAKGPDHASGYGNVNAFRAIRSVIQSDFFTGSVAHENAQSFNLEVPAGLRSLKLTLAWSDVPAQANAAKALVNDLDLELIHLSTGQLWRPWVLSRFPHRDSLQLPAVRNTDTLNNIEQVTVDAPPAGSYLVRVKGSRITNSTQAYFIAYLKDTANRFEWAFPMKHDPMQAGTNIMLRWNASFAAGAMGQLEFSLDGSNWRIISSNIDLSKNYVRWNAPDTFSTALLRMTVSGNQYQTDTFVLSKLLNTQVGFNCLDSFLFSWNRPVGVQRFRVYQLGPKYLEPVTITSDTFYAGAQAMPGSRRFTIAPLINGREGIRAYTFDYSTQGVGCYFKTFLAQLETDKALLQLELGTVHKVSKVLVQKLSGNDFTTIQTVDDPSVLAFGFTDANLQHGVNAYRVALQLTDGRIIYSQVEVVYYLKNANYLIYPNPAGVNRGFRILQKEPSDIRILIHDASGRLIKDQTYNDVNNAVSTFGLKAGLYVVTILRDGKKPFVSKLVLTNN